MNPCPCGSGDEPIRCACSALICEACAVIETHPGQSAACCRDCARSAEGEVEDVRHQAQLRADADAVEREAERQAYTAEVLGGGLVALQLRVQALHLQGALSQLLAPEGGLITGVGLLGRIEGCKSLSDAEAMCCRHLTPEGLALLGLDGEAAGA